MYIPKEIPKISDGRLKDLARTIRPVVSLTTLPMGKYPQEEVKTYFIKLPKGLQGLRGHNFLGQDMHHYSRPVRLVEERKIKTLHEPGSAGRMFHPSVDEVLAQIPDHFLGPNVLPANRIVAFETYLEKFDPEYDESRKFHVATTVLLIKGSPVTGKKMRTHYT